MRARQRRADRCWEVAEVGMLSCPDVVVLREVAAEGVALVQVFFIGHPRYDLVLDAEEVFVPVGLHFVNVEAGMVIERQVERAGDAFEDAQLAQARLVIAALFAGELAVVELRQKIVHVGGFKLASGKHHEVDSGLAGDFQKHPVVGVVLGVPEDHGRAFHTPGTAVEDGESGRIEILQDFLLQCVEIQIHVIASALSQHQNIGGAGQVAGGGRNDRLRPDVNLAVLLDGGAHVGLRHKIHRLGWRRGL